MADTLDLSNITWIFSGADNDPSGPGLQAHHYSEKSVRELVISKQNSRVFPIDNRLVGRMEDQLVRWKPPPSSHQGTVQVIEGTHPYQQAAFSIGHTWTHIKDVFSVPKKMAQTPSPDRLTSKSSASDQQSFITTDLLQLNTHTSRTINAYPVTLHLSTGNENDPSHMHTQTNTTMQYSYHYPIPEYYLPRDTPRSQPLSAQSHHQNSFCLQWFCQGL